MSNDENGGGFVVLDTGAVDKAISLGDDLIRAYDALNADYERAVDALLRNWKGRGADAFRKDARAVKSNITGIYDILRTMRDTLSDCKAIFAECDAGLGEYNRNQKLGG